MNEHTKKLATYVGMRLSEKRKKRRLTLAYLAQRVNMSPQQLQKYERAHSTLSGPRLYQLADILRVDVNYFFSGFSEFETRMLPAMQIAVGHSASKTFNILLIENNENDAYRTRKALEKCDIKVNLFVLRDDVTVLKFLRNQVTTMTFPRPDLILLGLPFLKNDGTLLLRELKRDRTLSDIPIVVLTNSVDKQDMISCYTEHASGYMCKPFDFEELERTIKTLVSYWAHAVVLPSRHAPALFTTH
jgi:CheY-like chemotaxis protein